MRSHALTAWMSTRRAKSPDKTALIFGDRTVTYRELADGVDRVAAVLQARGVGKGDAVAFVGENSPEFLQVLFACAQLGAVFVPVNTRLAAREMEHVLTEEQRGMLLASDRPFVRAIGEILDHYFDFYLPTYGVRSSSLHDPLAAVIAAGDVIPSVAPRVPVTVDTSWGPGRGQTIADLRGQRLGARDHDGVRTRVVLRVDDPVADHLVATILAG